VRLLKPSGDKSEKDSLCRFARGDAKPGFDLFDLQKDAKKSRHAPNRGGSRRSPMELGF
jgi:hypothetical protein